MVTVCYQHVAASGLSCCSGHESWFGLSHFDCRIEPCPTSGFCITSTLTLLGSCVEYAQPFVVQTCLSHPRRAASAVLLGCVRTISIWHAYVRVGLISCSCMTQISAHPSTRTTANLVGKFPRIRTESRSSIPFRVSCGNTMTRPFLISSFASALERLI